MDLKTSKVGKRPRPSFTFRVEVLFQHLTRFLKTSKVGKRLRHCAELRLRLIHRNLKLANGLDLVQIWQMFFRGYETPVFQGPPETGYETGYEKRGMKQV